ncbi:hypothetical protein [Bradyrhizobium neotropicale]|uniref:hypothetical protein n=1 Tax=Bradyrhizobium neotropicale TaxID=1497615 RepID=UPI001FD89152|nr:hypothetical protein [Bradyrhizobium neotropicale]
MAQQQAEFSERTRWIPLYLLQQRGLDLRTVGVVAPIPFAMATIAIAIGGWVMTGSSPNAKNTS